MIAEDIVILRKDIGDKLWGQYISDIRHLAKQINTILDNEKQIKRYNKIMSLLDDPVDKLLSDE